MICIGFRLANEFVLKLLRLLLGCYNFSSHPILLPSSHDMYTDATTLLHRCQYVFLHVFLHVQPPWQPPKSFSFVASNIWNTLPNHLSSIFQLFLHAFRRALIHHLFLLAYPDSRAKSGKIKPAQCITLRDTAPTTGPAPPGNAMPPSEKRLRLVKVIHSL